MAKPEGKDAFVRNLLTGGVVFVLGCSAFSALVPEHADATQPQQQTETTVTAKAPASKPTGSLPMLAPPSDKKPSKKSQSGGGGGAGAN